ncbi:MAG TPA: hypothetical protein VIR31_07840, partial [Nitrososphaeraceae archaeon]
TKVLSVPFTLIDSLKHEVDFLYDDSIYLELTKLRSINNEPIYSHMIVKNEFGTYYEVDMFDYEYMYYLSKFKLEIVGNRFQHPHLLELCK